MNLGVKFLIGALSLSAASCGGYVVYKKTFGSGEETSKKTEVDSSNSSGETGVQSPAVTEPSSSDAGPKDGQTTRTDTTTTGSPGK